MSGSRVKLVAGAAQWYEGRRLQPGDQFEASVEHAADLAAIGFASPLPAEPQRDSPLAGVTITAALLMAKKRGPDKKPRKKRKYQRRDMEAES